MNANEVLSEERATDYADFQHQNVVFRTTYTGGANTGAKAAQSVEPLEATGGLDVNEVAELVGISYSVVVGLQDQDQVLDGNTNPGTISAQGSIGINIDDTSDLVLGNANVGGETQPLEGNDDVISGFVTTTDKDEIIDTYRMQQTPGFDDDVNGAGGGGSNHVYGPQVWNLRELFGAGPVLDGNDDLGHVVQLTADQTDADFAAHVDARLIWDVALVENARNKFGLPSDD